jgi:hypothetical protein
MLCKKYPPWKFIYWWLIGNITFIIKESSVCTEIEIVEETMEKNTASKLGYYTSIFIAVLGGIYLLLLLYSISIAGFSFQLPQDVELAAGIFTLLTVQGAVVLFTAIRFVSDEDKQVFGSLGLSFIILSAAVVSINRFVQLTVIRQSLPDVPADLTRFLPYAEGSVMFALEVLGWGFFSSLAALFVAPLFSSSRLNIAIRWLFILYAVLSFLSVISFATRILIPTGPIAWGPVLFVLSILLAFYFRNFDSKAP